MMEPRVIVLFSGKRKCGKDFIAEKLQSILGEESCTIVRISEPIKSHYAKENNLNLSELMSENPYKEKYRREMIKWSDEVRSREPGYFCKAACQKADKKKIWIVSDIRRKTDVQWFTDTYGDKIQTVRISTDPEIRVKRGWTFTPGVDDVASECDLDDYKNWDLEIENNDSDVVEQIFSKLTSFILSLC